MKVGIDVHGVIDEEKEIFIKLSQELKELGYEIHILTGARLGDRIMNELEGIEYDHIFSILEYHAKIETKMWIDDDGNEWIPDEVWDSTKGVYCEENDIDLHIDDTKRYGKYFSTPFVHLTPNDEYPRRLELGDVSEDNEIIRIIDSISNDKIVISNEKTW